MVAAVGLAIVFLLPHTGHFSRTSSLVSLLLGLVVQAPLGWWLVRSVGTPRFMGAWVLGMAVRFVLLAIAALLLFPALGWPLSPGLLVLGGVLVALLLVEGLVAWLNYSRVEAR